MTADFIAPVIAWFRKNRRALPFRENRDPYRIWVSEVMLQQTRIEAAIPYFLHFMEENPDLASLAACPDEKLYKLWEGLGYYSRVRNLKRAAVQLMTSYGGTFPRTAKELEKLPGIGSYTAGAIASIAFGEPAPAVDGNVLRVMTRLFADPADISLPATRKRIEEELRAIYPTGDDAGDLTQGIMEIGERICLPNTVPLCDECPLAGLCLAKRVDKCLSFPKKSPKKERKILDKTLFLFSVGEEFALEKRPPEGLLASLWGFPMADGALKKEEVIPFLKNEGLSPLSVKSAGRAKHVFTHLEWHITGYFVELPAKNEKWVWETPEKILAVYSIPSAFRAFRKKLLTV